MSPAAMNEESRRDLIARQHRALYGHDAGALSPSGTLGDEPHNFRPENLQQGAKNASIAARGGSPRGVDPFLGQTHSQHGSENQPQTTSASAPSATAPVTRSPSNSISSPSNSNQTGYGMFDGQQQQTHGHNVPTATGNPESSSSMRGSSSNAPVGPIGSRPAQPSAGQAPNPALNKRSTTPLPSPLSYGFSPNDVNSSGLPNATASGDQGSASSTTNRPTPATSTSSSIKESSPTVGLSWGSGSGVWRSKNSLGVQASVWG
ncbi:hypothetical protein FQN57_005232 [Myotisia sp. PD_48]|nr:hypothetical protein FQN57_005232 [Myotisia sp. PD_48]